MKNMEIKYAKRAVTYYVYAVDDLLEDINAEVSIFDEPTLASGLTLGVADRAVEQIELYSTMLPEYEGYLDRLKVDARCNSPLLLVEAKSGVFKDNDGYKQFVNSAHDIARRVLELEEEKKPRIIAGN